MLNLFSGDPYCKYEVLADINALRPDSSLTASDSASAAYGPKYSRLNNQQSNGGWVLTSSATIGEWIMVCLGSTKSVQRIATQGRYSIYHANWVKSYKVSYSLDGTQWSYVLDDAGDVNVFPGNYDKNTIVSHDITPVLAQYVRLYPETWEVKIALRWGVFGCEPNKGV